jgi:hypothetical protein
MALANGDILVYDGSQWNNQQSVPGSFTVGGTLTATDPSNDVVFGTGDNVSRRWMIGHNSRNQLILQNSNPSTTITGNGGTVAVSNVGNLFDVNEGNYGSATIASTSDTILIEIINSSGFSSQYSQAMWWPSVIARAIYPRSITVEAIYDGHTTYQTVWQTTTNAGTVWLGTILVPPDIASPWRIKQLKFTLTNWSASSGSVYLYSVGLHHRSETPFPQYVSRNGSTLYGLQPPDVSSGNGSAAATMLQVTGGKGGKTTDASNKTGGAGASSTLAGGDGGDAVSGSTNGTGGSLTLNAGAAGTGGSGGSRGYVLMQTGGGNVGIGTSSPAQKLVVEGGAGVNNGITVRMGSDADLRLSRTDSTAQTYLLRTAADRKFYIIDELASGSPARLAIDTSGYVSIGSSSPNSQLQVNGPIATAVTNVTTTPYTVTPTDSVVRVGTDSGAITVNLPTAANITGRHYTIKRVSGANNVTITPYGSETIDGAPNYGLNALYKYVALVSDGTNWAVVANN